MRRILFLLLRLTGIPFLLREIGQRNKVTILCYHDPSPETVKKHLEFLNKAYNIIPLRRYVNWRQQRAVELMPQKALVLTFDDGYRDNYKLKTILEDISAPVTIFLCSNIVGTSRHYWWTALAEAAQVKALKALPDKDRLARLSEEGFNELQEYDKRQSLSSEEIAELEAMVDFQAHSRLHPILPRCPHERAVDEIVGAKSELESRFGLDVYAFAYPNGDYTDRDVALARSAGYECALTIDGGSNDSNTDLFRIRRVRVTDDADINELIVKASGLWDLILTLIGRRHGPGLKAVA